MEFSNKYTTSELIAADSVKPEKEQTGESKKIPVSNDAYAIGEMINTLIIKIEHARLSLMK